MTVTVCLFCNNLRVRDNAALHAAAASASAVVPVYILDDVTPGRWRLGGAARWWLHQSLYALARSLAARGSRLILLRGETVECLRTLRQQCPFDSLHLQHGYAPWDAKLEKAIQKFGEEHTVDVQFGNDRVLFPPEQVRNKQGLPFRVFTPFWRHCLGRSQPESPLPAPKAIPAPAAWPASMALEDLELVPSGANWPEGLLDAWAPGEDAALSKLDDFTERGVHQYATDRDRPDLADGTSRLSPHIRFGEIGPRTIWQRVVAGTRSRQTAEGASTFLKEIGWREFCYHLLHHFPQLPEREFQSLFQEFPWQQYPAGLRSWQIGRTGVPIVDAGMRQLRRTGWMHNRVRMIVASFLTKNLLIDWRAGQDWFWDNLVDADIANNSAGWQWVAGCGADAAPYFRIFNPVLQGRKFDPSGDYVREFVTELSEVELRRIHEPWAMNEQEQQDSGVRIGTTYPEPMVELADSRNRALTAYERLRVERHES